ncbi:NTP transferase domain-containing protein [Streptosporangiaceae bacterium NEAU-GS5]|nr:NTP transferase domain-containing protein [Streptosporangiaceae bacterium NEAU-GS5]
MPVDIVGVVQARMGSTRLPGKVLRDLRGRSVLGWVVRAAEQSGALDDLIVATTTETEDDAVASACARLGVRCHRGPVDDVLTRFVEALGGATGAVMRLTADCPLLDPAVLRQAAAVFAAVNAEGNVDYVSLGLPHTLPRGAGDAEVVSVDALRRIDALATGYHRAHVTSYAYCHPEDFRVLGLTYAPDASDLRVTLDTPDDWAVIERVAGEFGDRAVPVGTLVSWLRAHPEVSALNAHVRQKELQQA